MCESTGRAVGSTVFDVNCTSADYLIVHGKAVGSTVFDVNCTAV